MMNRRSFSWSEKSLLQIRAAVPGITQGELIKLFRYNNAMNGLKRRELLPPGAVMPDLDPLAPGVAKALEEKEIAEKRTAERYLRNYPSFINDDPRSKDNYLRFKERCLGRARSGYGLRSVRWLDLAYTTRQEKMLEPTFGDVAIGKILREADKRKWKRYLPERRFNFIGELNGMCFVANTPERLTRQWFALNFSSSLRLHNEVEAGKDATRQSKQQEKDDQIKYETPAKDLLVLRGFTKRRPKALTIKLMLSFLKAKGIKTPAVAKRNTRPVLIQVRHDSHLIRSFTPVRISCMHLCDPL